MPHPWQYSGHDLITRPVVKARAVRTRASDFHQYCINLPKPGHMLDWTSLLVLRLCHDFLTQSLLGPYLVP